MARSSKPQSSDEPTTEDSNSAGDVPIEDEEELRAVERTAESEEEEDAKGDDAAVQEDDDDEGDNTNEISKREKARLKQMEAIKRKKIQEILDNQNASIDADMNIGAGNRDDAFYRYKMPRMITKIEGRGNGIRTNIVNMVDIAKALARPASYPTKYFGNKLGAQSKFDEKTGTSLNFTFWTPYSYY